MAERATIFQTTQLGVEVTPGTGVTPTKTLSSVGFEIDPQPEIGKFRPQGRKFATVTTLNKEHTELSIEGALTYTEIVYLFSGLFNQVTPTGAGAAKTWEFEIDSDGADDVQTYTLRQGDSTRAIEVNHVLITGLALEFSREGIEVSGEAIGTEVDATATMAAGTTQIDLLPVQGQDIAVYLENTYAALAAASPKDRTVSVSMELNNRFAPAWFLNQQTSYDDHVEVEPASTIEFLHAADATGMGLFATMRAGATKYLRIECTGPTIGAGPDTNLIQIDMAVKVMDVGALEDSDGIYAVQFDFELFDDEDLGGAIKATVVNEIAALA